MEETIFSHQLTLLKPPNLLTYPKQAGIVASIVNQKLKAPIPPAIGILAGLSEEKRELLCAYGDFINLEDGHHLIEEGKHQDSIYFIISGVLQVYTDQYGQYTLIALLGPGESIGEINVFDPARASASVTAHSNAQIWKANRNDFEALIQTHPEIGEHLLIELVSQLSQRIRHLNKKFLAIKKFGKSKKIRGNKGGQHLPSGLLEGLSEAKRKLLFAYGDFMSVEDGHHLIEEGKHQDSIYFIISGVLQVYTDQDGQYTPIALLGPGESIGEINVFDPARASASVTAHSNAQIWKANRNDFEALIQTHPEIGEHLLIELVSQLSQRIREMNKKLLAMEHITGVKTKRICKHDIDRGVFKFYPSKDGWLLIRVIENGEIVQQFRSHGYTQHNVGD